MFRKKGQRAMRDFRDIMEEYHCCPDNEEIEQELLRFCVRSSRLFHTIPSLMQGGLRRPIPAYQVVGITWGPELSRWDIMQWVQKVWRGSMDLGVRGEKDRPEWPEEGGTLWIELDPMVWPGGWFPALTQREAEEVLRFLGQS